MRTTTKTKNNTGQIMTNGVYVERTNIIGTNVYVYSAWRQTSERFRGVATTICHVDGIQYGRIGTDPDKKLYGHLPCNDARIAACDAAHAERYLVAYDAITSIFPESKNGQRSMGQIELTFA